MAMAGRTRVSPMNDVDSTQVDEILDEYDVREDVAVAPAIPDIQALIAEEIRKALASQPTAPPVVLAETRTQAAYEPPKYLNHYRCDLSPDVQILARSVDKESDELGAPRKGEWIKFRRGHFFSTEQWQDDQLEWMMRHPLVDPTNPERIIGGAPSIYKDDGNELTKCKYGCDEVFIMGSNAYKAHIRATHGVTV